MELSQLDTVLKYLYDNAPESVGVRHMAASIDVPRRNLATIVWELERDGLVEKAGGKRGHYYYVLTSKGRAECGRRFRSYGEVVRGNSPLHTQPMSDFEELQKLLDNKEEYKKLSAFVRFVVLEFELGDELNRPNATLLEVLDRAVKKYLGLNPDKLSEEKSWY